MLALPEGKEETDELTLDLRLVRRGGWRGEEGRAGEGQGKGEGKEDRNGEGEEKRDSLSFPEAISVFFFV